MSNIVRSWYKLGMVLALTNFYLLSAQDINCKKEYSINKLVDSDHDTFYPVYILNTSDVVFKTADVFLSFSIDTKSVRDGLNKTLLRDSKLINMLSYLSPGYLRVGGTESDRLKFQEDSFNSDNSIYRPILPVNNTFLMTADDWLAINTFAQRTGFKILFDVNVLLRRGSSWDSSNAQQLLDFSARHNLSIDWQLGNEPNAFLHTFNVALSPTQLAADYHRFRTLLNSYRVYQNSSLVGPEVTSPHRKKGKRSQDVEMPSQAYLSEFVTAGGADPVSAISWHQLKVKFYGWDKYECVVCLSAESGSASGGGVTGVTDRFLASFLFLDRLGLAAKHGISLIVRQSLYAGSYALIHLKTVTPNPDWWVAFLYKTLVTSKVLRISPISQTPRTLRLYAHCSHNNTAVVFGLNVANTSQVIKINSTSGSKAGLYQLTAPHLLSKEVRLNGKPLLPPGRDRPSLPPLPVNLDQPLSLQPHSMFFLHITEPCSQSFGGCCE